MYAAASKDDVKERSTNLQSVAVTIIGEFFDVLEKEEGLDDVASRLRKVVLEDGIFAEPSIRAALFPDAS